ncbi:hypothetical protein L7F22_061428 [Adiantum nelumboides]|nr:hypothetical protein [Adiantum nelumboides]
MVKVEEEVSKLGEAHSLYFDGAYKRKVDKAVVEVVIYDEEGKKVFGKGLMLGNVHSNNEAEYAALILSLEWCLNLGIKRLNDFGDALLLVKQVHGTWACKNQGLEVRLRRVKELLKRFEVAYLLHVPRKNNQEADALESEQLQDVTIGAIALQQPQFQGSDCMPEILHFFEIGECLEGLSKGERQWLVRKATKFRLINDDLYCKGQDQVLRRVPLSCEIQDILFNCHSGVCGGHFSHDITSRKIPQAGFVWPSVHQDVQHWCQSCHRCQLAGDRRLTYEPQTPILAHGPFEKWRIDAIGPLPRATSGKLYIIMGVDYMTSRWAEATITSRITAVVSKLKEWDKHLEAALWSYRTSFRTSLGYTPYHLVFGKEAILPMEVQLASLRVLASGRETPKEQLQQRILDLERLELNRTSAIEFYATHDKRRRQKFNEGLKDKELKRGMLVLRYDNRFYNRKDKKFLSRWEGPFLIRKKYINGSYQLQEINGRLHKTWVNCWRLKPYFQRFDSELWFELPLETEADEEKSSSSIPCYEDPEERLEA